MSNDYMKSWLTSGKRALIAGLSLRPIEHPILPGSPLAVMRGQAEAYFLEDDSGRRYILKRFHAGLRLNRAYLEAVNRLVPLHTGFVAATERRLLSTRDVTNGAGCYCPPGLASWLDGVLLMPRIGGVDWSSLADDLREGDIALQRDHRLTLARGLTELVSLLESRRCAHRDLSCGNVFVNPTTLTIRLIDFDSFFHPTLPMPAETTCATSGYAAPWLWVSNQLSAAASWATGADRFAMSILIAEFLVMDRGSPVAEEGGLFRQDELRARRGPSVDGVRSRLAAEFPAVAGMFDRALHAGHPGECPTAAEWHLLVEHLLGKRKAPQLKDLAAPNFAKFVGALMRRQPARPLWPAPRLSELPPLHFNIPKARPRDVVTPPDNPWRGQPHGARS